GPVVGTVVAHDRFDGHTALGEPLDGTFEESGRGRPAFVGEDFDVGEPGAVVDGNVDELPSGTPVSLLTVSGDSVPWAIKTAEFLDVEMDQLSWVSTAIPVRRFGRRQARQPVQSEPAQDRT